MNFVIDLYSRVQCPEFCAHCPQMQIAHGSFSLEKVIETAEDALKDGDKVFLVSNYGALNFSPVGYLLCYALARRFPKVNFLWVSHKEPELLGKIRRKLGNVQWRDCRSFILQSKIPHPDGDMVRKPFQYLYREVESCIV